MGTPAILTAATTLGRRNMLAASGMVLVMVFLYFVMRTSG